MSVRYITRFGISAAAPLVLATVLGVAGCASDLTVKNLSVQWPETGKTASATIVNQGLAGSGPFEVYFTPEECPNSSNRRPQQSVNVAGLAPGAQLALSTRFDSLAHNDNANLGKVYSVRVRVDPKNRITESNEINNWDSRPVLYDVSGLTIHTYNEALATILRGINLDVAAAGELELVPGYYKISEHRVWTQPNERVIALHIFKNYFESAVGASSPPRRDEPFVFSIIDRYQYDVTGYRFTGRDFHGHTLKFDIAFRPECCEVTSVELNCTRPGLTVQTYGGGQLNTCGVTSEPPWSRPLWESD